LSNEEARKFSIGDTLELHDLVIEHADQVLPYKKSIVSKEKVLVMLKGQLTSETNLNAGWVKKNSAEALSIGKRTPEELWKYAFTKRNGCWMLEAIFKEFVPPPRLLPAQSQEKGRSCLRTANRFKVMAARAEDYDRALYAYLCAAQNGSTQGAILAAQLGTSGQSRRLPNDYVEKLFMQAANQGDPSAMMAIAEMKCGELPVCASQSESYMYLSKAILAGKHDAINLLGVWVERGSIGKPDPSRALACYRLAAERGSKVGAENLRRLISVSRDFKPAQCLLSY
jgi:hypothetical protein